ncbi:MAG: protein-L-isoaspartate(D-aspartate) O-methyltransferase [Bacteroidota bacterium]
MPSEQFHLKGLRHQLIDQLEEKGINDKAVLKVMRNLPRHYFLDNAFAEQAYQDKAFPIGREQTISQPYTVAFMTEALNVKKRHRVLEVGTGSGYQACILQLLGARVFTIERQEFLYNKTKKRLEELGFTMIRCFWKDGYLGLPEWAPFDRIIVTAGAKEFPQILLEQLKIGGIMIIPVGEPNQKMCRITRIAKEEWQHEELGNFRFVPFLKGLNRE